MKTWAVYFNGRRYRARVYAGDVGLITLAGGEKEAESRERAKRLAALYQSEADQAREERRQARRSRREVPVVSSGDSGEGEGGVEVGVPQT